MNLSSHGRLDKWLVYRFWFFCRSRRRRFCHGRYDGGCYGWYSWCCYGWYNWCCWGWVIWSCDWLNSKWLRLGWVIWPCTKLWFRSIPTISFTPIDKPAKTNHFCLIRIQEAIKSNQACISGECNSVSGVRTIGAKRLTDSFEGRHYNLSYWCAVPQNIHPGYFLCCAKIPCLTIPLCVAWAIHAKH